MAEIKIQRRQRSPWPWIIGIIILAGFIWFMLTYVYMPEGNEGEVLAGDSTYTKDRYVTPADTANEVRDFIEYTQDTTQTLSPKRYTEQGLIKLQSALSYVADRTDSTKIRLTEEIDSLDRTIVKIDTTSRSYLSQVKPALSAAANAIESIKSSGSSAPHLGQSDLKRIESGIDTSKSLESQLGKIKEFFAEAGNALQQVKLSREYSLNKRSY